MATKKKFVIQRRPFQLMFLGMNQYLEESKPLYKKISETDIASIDNESVASYQALYNKEKVLSISSFLLGMNALESFANCLYDELKYKESNELADIYFGSHRRIKDFKLRSYYKWILKEKLYFLPSLILVEGKLPPNYIDKESLNWKKLEEIIDIRNEIVHLKPRKLKGTVERKDNGEIIMKNSDKDSEWRITQIPKDSNHFDSRQAEKTVTIILHWKNEILKLLGAVVPKDFLTGKKMEVEGDSGFYSVK